jgi:hypothetical protein
MLAFYVAWILIEIAQERIDASIVGKMIASLIEFTRNFMMEPKSSA